MENKICPNCGSMMIEGKIWRDYYVMFIPKGEEMKFFSQAYSNICCDACPKCGKIENLRLENPENILKAKYK